MPYVDTFSITTTEIGCDIKGLGAPQNEYNGFRVRINGGSWATIPVISGYTERDTGNHLFTYLNPGTEYHIEGQVNWLGTWVDADDAYATTTIGTPTGLTSTARTTTSITLDWGNIAGTQWYRVEYKRHADPDWIYYDDPTSSAVLVDGLLNNTSYDFRVRAETMDTHSSWSSTYTTSTNVLGVPGNLHADAIGATTVDLDWNAVNEADDYYVYRDGNYIGTTGGTDYHVANLTPETQYTFTVKAHNAGGYSSPASLTVTTAAARPANWDWATVKTAGAVLPTYNGDPYPVTKTEWDNFQARINEFRVYRGLQPYTFFDTFSGLGSFTRPVRGATLYAYFINQAITAIGQCNPSISPPAQIAAGVAVTAAVFNSLRNSLNSIP